MPSETIHCEQLFEEIIIARDKIKLTHENTCRNMLQLKADYAESTANWNKIIAGDEDIRDQRQLEKVVEVDNKKPSKEERRKEKLLKQKSLDIKLHFCKKLIREKYSPKQAKEIIKDMGLFSGSKENQLKHYNEILSRPVGKNLNFFNWFCDLIVDFCKKHFTVIEDSPRTVSNRK